MSDQRVRVGIVMGSDSDWPVMEKAYNTLRDFGVGAEVRVLSAHRRPEQTAEYARTARERGLAAVIAGAGGAAHLPGVVASLTSLPVIGVPVQSKDLQGLDSLLSIVQMPPGVPVATVGIGRAANAALLALQIIGVADEEVARAVDAYKRELVAKGEKADEGLQDRL